MPTRKPLRDMLPDIKQHIQNHTAYLEYNQRLFLVHEGQLRKEIEESLAKELSPESYKKAIQRVPSINLLIRIIDKLSRVYSEPVLRTTISESDQKLVREYETEARVNEAMASANQMYNLHKCVALEPFIEDGCPKIRVLPAHQFLVFSDDLVNPLRPTVFIKFMGKCYNIPFTDRDGRKTEINVLRELQVIYLWSDTEFMIIDSEGQERPDLMAERQVTGVNPLGRLPMTYINRSKFRLIPVPDTDTLENTVLIPKLLADLNFAVQFQSHSVLIATDLNVPADVTMSPDVIWNMTSSDETKQGRFDSIKPSVDILQVLELIKTTLSIWLESRNIRAGDMGQVSPGDAASGVARIIDESDATQDRQSQCSRFLDAERDYWKLQALIHNYWVDNKLLEPSAEFSGTFSDKMKVAVRFGDQKPVVTDRENVEVVALKLTNKLITIKQAIKELNPSWTDDEVDAQVKELEANAAKEQSQLAAQGNTGAAAGPGNTAGGGGSPAGHSSGASAGPGPGGKVAGQPDQPTSPPKS